MSKLPGLVEAVTRLESVWAGADDATGLSREQLIAVNDAIGVVQRRLDAAHADVAARIADESRTELGSGSLAKEHGYRTAGKLLAATGGISAGDASRLVKVGEATAPRTDLLGAMLPARYALLREALASGALSIAAAGLIIALLDRCRVVAGVGRIGLGEEILAERCAGLGLDDVRKVIARAEAWLDPDGVEPKDEERRAKRSCTVFERDGMVHLNAVLDAETAAPVVTALRGYVTAAFNARMDAPNPDAADADRRTVPMLQADALAMFAAHVLGCESRVPLAGATVIVRGGTSASTAPESPHESGSSHPPTSTPPAHPAPADDTDSTSPHERALRAEPHPLTSAVHRPVRPPSSPRECVRHVPAEGAHRPRRDEGGRRSECREPCHPRNSPG